MLRRPGFIDSLRAARPDEKALLGREIFRFCSLEHFRKIEEADHAVLFRPPDQLIKEKPEYPRVKTHEELKKHLQNIFSSMIES